MVCSDNVPAQHLYECLGYLQIFQAQLFQLQKCGDQLPSKGGSSSLILPLHLLRSLRIVQDPWAVRAVPADNGEIDRIRVMNFGYSKGLSKARGMVPGLLDRRSRAAGARRTKPLRFCTASQLPQSRTLLTTLICSSSLHFVVQSTEALQILPRHKCLAELGLRWPPS